MRLSTAAERVYRHEEGNNSREGVDAQEGGALRAYHGQSVLVTNTSILCFHKRSENHLRIELHLITPLQVVPDVKLDVQIIQPQLQAEEQEMHLPLPCYVERY